MLIEIGDIVQMRKKHPCGSDQWVITRTGADVKMKCCGCSRLVMLDRELFEKRAKKLIQHSEAVPGGKEEKEAES